jgi:hypothetical protein
MSSDLFIKISEKDYKTALESVKKIFKKQWISEQDQNDLEWLFLELRQGDIKSAESFFYSLETHPRDMIFKIYNKLI